MATAEAEKRARDSRSAETHALVRAAAGGDMRAWEELVDRYNQLVRTVAFAHRLTGADVEDVVQTTWLRALEHLKRMRQPERIAAWLVTVARRECLMLRKIAARTVPTTQERLATEPDSSLPLDAELLAAERKVMVERAWRTLTPRERGLLRLLHWDAPLSYHAIGTALQMPVGSIGPTRGRALRRLRDSVGAQM